jgi:hypothetical protein
MEKLDWFGLAGKLIFHYLMFERGDKKEWENIIFL